MPTQPAKLILASASERRRALLAEVGYQFEVIPALLDEPPPPCHDVDPIAHAESLAFFKASSLAESHPDAVILGADTIAALGSEIIGKPADRDDARRILKKLSNTTHRVITGVALLHPESGRRLIRHDLSTVHVRPLPDTMIEAYLDTCAWQGKAGAYGIQDRDDPFVDCIEGHFNTVVGLPLELVARMFEQWKSLE